MKINRYDLFGKFFVCIFLCISMLVCSLPVKAEEISTEENKTYISDIKLVNTKDNSEKGSAAAKKELEDAGYTVIPYDLNSGTSKGWAYLGYKTTQDPDEAITDLKIMDMNGAYTFNENQKALENYYKKTTEMTEHIAAMAESFVDHYLQGSPAAIDAKKILDLIVDPDNDNQSLGEYFVRTVGTAEWEKSGFSYINRFMMEAHPDITTTIYSQLMLGCVDYDPNYIPAIKTVTEEEIEQLEEEIVEEDNWIDKSTDTETEEDEKVSADENEEDPELEETDELQEETDENNENDEVTEGIDEEDSDIDEQEEAEQAEETVEEEINDPDPLDIPYSWLYRFSQVNLEMVNGQSELKDRATELLPAIQMEASMLQEALKLDESSWSYDQKIAVNAYRIMNQYQYNGQKIGEYLYLNSSLTALDLYPLVYALTSAQQSSVLIVGLPLMTLNIQNTKEAREQVSSYVDHQLINGGVEKVSIWTGRIDEMYNEKVAFTSSTIQRQKELNYDPNEYQRIFTDTSMEMNLENVQKKLEPYAKLAGIALTFMLAGTTISSVVAGWAGFATVAAHISIFGGWLNVIDLIITVALLVVVFICYLIETYQYYHPDYTDMPIAMYDLKSNAYEPKYVRYELVTSPSGENVDLNTFQAYRWLALYSTKDSAAGDPIEADFVVQQGSSTNPEGYSPLSLFGERVACNTNLYAYKDERKGIYMFFHRDGENETGEEHKYIRSLFVKSAADDEQARLQVMNTENSFLLNSDLTDGRTSGVYTYIGYTTTDNPKEAVRDIRAGFAQTYSSTVGESSYASAGTIGNVQLLYSKVESTGEPILSGSNHLYITRDTSTEVPEGAEPVNLLNGGPAFNLNYENEIRWYEGIGARHPVYLYFMPEITYTSGTEYLGGIVFFDGIDASNVIPLDGFADKVSGTLINKVIEESGYERLDKTLMKGVELGYTKTYNPKRAIRGFTFFQTGTSEATLNTGITKAHIKDDVSNKVNYMLVPAFCVKNFETAEDYVNGILGTSKINVKNNGYYKDGVTNGLYFTMNTGVLDPIVFDEWYVSEESMDQLGLDQTVYGSVDRILYTNGKAADLRSGMGQSNPLYMYYPKKQVSQPTKYVSNISLSWSKTSKEDAIQKLLDTNKIPVDTYAGCVSDSDNSYKYLAIGVQMTDDEDEALHDIRLIYIPNNQLVKASISMYYQYTYANGGLRATYKRVGSNNDYQPVYKTKNGGYYLYTSTNINQGEPITSITFNNKLRLDGSELVQAYSVEDSTAQSENLTENLYTYFTRQRSADAALYDKFESYIYITREEPFTYIYDVDAYTGYFSWLSDNDKNSFIKKGMWNLIKKDLNADAGGRYQYLTYARGYQESLAITDFMVVTSGKDKKPDSSIEVVKNNHTITYYLACGGTDLNTGAGGDYIYLYYTRDWYAGDPIVDIQVQVQSSKTPQEYKGIFLDEQRDYESVKYKNGSIADFNKGAGGDYVYMYILREERYADLPETQNMSGSIFFDHSSYGYGMMILFTLLTLLLWGGTYAYRKRLSATGKDEEIV